MNQRLSIVKSLFIAVVAFLLMPSIANAQWSQIYSSVYLSNSNYNVRLGGSTPTAFSKKYKLSVYANPSQGGIYSRSDGGAAIYGYNVSSTGWAGYFYGRSYFREKTGVGTSNFPSSIGGANISSYRLFVKGGILTEEVRVRTGWADYVFDEAYDLKSLNQVESFIEENGHLPNVPSAEKVEAEGIELGDITRIQQEKIEELFLHMIEINKQMELLKKENEMLKTKLAEIKK